MNELLVRRDFFEAAPRASQVEGGLDIAGIIARQWLENRNRLLALALGLGLIAALLRDRPLT